MLTHQHARCLSIALVLFTATTMLADDWPMYLHDSQHTGQSTASYDPHNLSLAWTSPAYYRYPILVGDTVFGSASDPIGNYQLGSFSLHSGQINWQVPGVAAHLAYADGWLVYPRQGQLFVRDAATGALRYSVSLPAGSSPEAATLAHDASGALAAYVSDGYNVTAVRLNANGGNILWTQSGHFTQDSFPTVVGNSIVVTASFNYWAFDRMTGVMNPFHAGGGGGGGGNTVAFDSHNSQFYVLASYNNFTPTLSAYQYTNNSSINLLWQRQGAGIGDQNVAVAGDGTVYVSDRSTLLRLNPQDGSTLDSVATPLLANGGGLMLSSNAVWTYTDHQTLAYDRQTLELLTTLPGSRANVNTPFHVTSTIADNAFVLDDENFGTGRFSVYVVPEPAMCGSVLLLALLLRRASRA